MVSCKLSYILNTICIHFETELSPSILALYYFFVTSLHTVVVCKCLMYTDNEMREYPRCSATSFGMGRRVCPGELLAKSRIFLFLAGILQKFDIGRAADLPDRDVRSYPLSVVIDPPPVKAIFTLRNCVE